jgi:hypothetical protein
MVMGCYGIGISRTMQAIIEQSHDADGIIWPWNVAPFHVLVCVLDPQLPEAMDLAKKLGAAAEKAGADVLIDDRAERPGVKFKDADLVGFPLRLTIGGKGLKEGIIELKARSQKDVAKIPTRLIPARGYSSRRGDSGEFPGAIPCDAELHGGKSPLYWTHASCRAAPKPSPRPGPNSRSKAVGAWLS